MLRELIFAARRLRQSVGFTVIALGTLALGIGATTAVFTVVQHVILQPLPFRDSGRLVALWERVKWLESSFPVLGPNPRHVFLWQEEHGVNNAFQSIAVFRHGATGLTVGTDEHPRLAGVLIGSANMLSTLGVHPVLGRDLGKNDTIAGRDAVALISYRLWQSQWNKRPDVIGRIIRLSNRPLTIIGVLPPHFDAMDLGSSPTRNYIAGTEVMVPAVMDPLQDFGLNSDYGNWNAVARLRPHVSIAEAQARLDAAQRNIARAIESEGHPMGPDALLSKVEGLREAVVGEVARPLWFLFAAVLGLLLIAAVNISNAQLSRALAQEQEVAVRSALGASKWQLLMGPLFEGLLLACGGGALGICLAVAILRLLQAADQGNLPRLAEVQIDGPVLLFSSLVVAGATLLAGLGPAFKRLTAQGQKALQGKSRGRGIDTRRLSRHAGSLLIGVQIFACTVLLLLTGLLLDSLRHILNTDKGWSPAHIVAAQVELQTGAYQTEEARAAFIDGVLRNARAVPGVQSAALLSVMPLEGEAWLDPLYAPRSARQSKQFANWRRISSDYFTTMGQPLLAGRGFDERDRNRDSVILSQSTARAAFGSESALGKQIEHRRVYTVIGIARDARSTSLKETPPLTVYVNYKDRPPFDPSILVRSLLPTSAVAAQLRTAIWKQDKNVTIARVKTLDQQVNDSLATERLQAGVLSSFAGSALLLAMLGIYGVLSFAVRSRTQEIGLRVALGANRSNIYRIALAGATWPVLLGLGTGWLASLASGQLLRSLLFGVRVYDPVVTAGVLTLFLLAAAVASFVPAQRALAVDPMKALRDE